MGDGSHLRVAFEELHDVSGVWFSAIKSGSALPCASGDTRRVLYGIEDNYFNGQHRLQMHVSLMLDAPVT